MTPGEGEFASAELGRAHQSLDDARTLLDMGSLESAASRLYYASFHAARAALAVRGKHAKTHSGQLHLFTEQFGPAPILGRLLELRADADYGDTAFSVPEGVIAAAINETASFIERCEGIVQPFLDRGPDEPEAPADR